ncbi:putative voltage-gated potassium channel subunit beta [Platanthera guangdongensis]|uniref:Voltage-gated potassium channel subunit beta n=1 Tax=Platanthera guangdongensis TaxID=2320717 RepID=A0ABR2LPV5_9ASPA
MVVFPSPLCQDQLHPILGPNARSVEQPLRSTRYHLGRPVHGTRPSSTPLHNPSSVGLDIFFFRASRMNLATRSLQDEVLLKVNRLKPIADELDATLAQLAIAWCASNPNVSSVITGATKESQVNIIFFTRVLYADGVIIHMAKLPHQTSYQQPGLQPPHPAAASRTSPSLAASRFVES